MEEEKKIEEIQDANQEPGAEVKAEEIKQEKPKDKVPPKVAIPKSCGSCKKPVAKMRYYRNMQFFCNTKCWKDFKKKEEQRKLKETEAKKQQEQAPAA
ncbi:MAG: hypothetical protein KKD05_10300 [Candidatus Omnitrophica bacterium]|nr:hypothetical protein [Candidatus Omnitrophota bacterium]